MRTLFAVAAVAFVSFEAIRPLFELVARQRSLKREGWL